MPSGARQTPPQGTVVSTTSSSLTVKLSTGTTRTYTLGSGAVVQNNGSTSSLSALTAGEKVVIFTGTPGSTGTSSSSSTVATRVLAGSSATAAPSGAGGTAAGGQAGTAPQPPSGAST